MPSVATSKVPEVSTLPVASSSITVVGGTRPPVPITVAAGTARVPSTETDGEVISVVVRFAVVDPLGRYSDTVPPTAISWPTLTVGVLEVYTNTPSEVASLVSGHGSWNQKPVLLTAVTTPRTFETAWLFSGEMWALPWMSRMRVV